MVIVKMCGVVVMIMMCGVLVVDSCCSSSGDSDMLLDSDGEDVVMVAVIMCCVVM